MACDEQLETRFCCSPLYPGLKLWTLVVICWILISLVWAYVAHAMGEDIAVATGYNVTIADADADAEPGTIAPFLHHALPTSCSL